MPGVVEHLFRHEAVKMLATLIRYSAWNTLTLAEEVVTENSLRLDHADFAQSCARCRPARLKVALLGRASI